LRCNIKPDCIRKGLEESGNSGSIHSAFDMSEGIDNSLVDVYLVLIDFKLTEARSALKDDFA